MKKCLFSLAFLFFLSITDAQVLPNTRLFQLNTVKGSVLSMVEMSDNFVYHIGTSNASEVGFDSLISNSVGLDDLYILKSNATSGTNVWFKTFNAGNKGIISPRYTYIDSSENLYVFGQFSGTISVGSTSVTAINANDAFLMKIDSNGNALWVNYLENGYNSLYKIKTITDGVDTFIVYNNKLRRLNDNNGSLVYDNPYSFEVQSVALKNSNLYVAGSSTFGDVVIGSESIPTKSGFIVKGDKNANFTASCKTSGTGIGSVISDITFANDGKLLMSGFNTNSIDLLTETQNYSYTYNPNTPFPTLSLFYFTAKIDANLETVDFFRSSGAFSKDASYSPRADVFSSKLISTSTGFNLLLYVKDRNRVITTFTNSNSSTTTTPSPNPIQIPYTLLLQADNNGNYTGGKQPFYLGFRMAANKNQYSQTNDNIKIFATTINNASTGNIAWTKQKTTSIAGTLSSQYHQHLNSAKNELYVSSLVEGKANFFGKQVNNTPNVFSRFVTRLGEDGLPKWFVRFQPDFGGKELNTSNDIAALDQEDNFIFIASLTADPATLVDGTGDFFEFPTTGSSSKALIKIDKNGKYLWSKQFFVTGSMTAATTTDNIGDVYFIGRTNGGTLTVDNQTIGAGIFVVKFSKTGTFLYGKSYENVDAYSLNSVFDAQNNLHIFSEPINTTGNNYVFDGVTIPTNSNNSDHLMLKFNSVGNVIWGKNFYANAPNNSYSWPNDVVFDGQDFILMGNYYSEDATNFTGLDLLQIPKIYPNVNYIPFFSKISTDGTVLWQKPLHESTANTGNYTNINVDENKNIYMYFYAKDKLNYNNVEHSIDAAAGNKILMKLDTAGDLKYLKTVENQISANNYIDVMGDDKINVSGFTRENNLLNYPINYNRSTSLYFATFGNLGSYYMTPTKDYLLLNNLVIENNPNNENTFSFDLINNIAWNASSDQPWLNVSFLSLTGKFNFQNSINGNGDAKIIISASTNNTGVDRTANMMIGGNNVSSKTIAVTQSRILASGETKIFVTTLYPNPTSDYLNIETQQKISKIEIFDLSGKVMKTTISKDKKVSVSHLSKGLYIIKIHTENGIVNSKFIKN